ncbi:MAG: glycosyltransferase family 87 protein [Terriglobales bacterium]
MRAPTQPAVPPSKTAWSKQVRFSFLLALVACWGMNAYFNLLVPRAHRQLAAQGIFTQASVWSDLYPYWLGARYVVFRQGDPYSRDFTIANQTAMYGHPLDPSRPDPLRDERRFMYPAYVCLLLAPVAPLPFPLLLKASILLFAMLTAGSVFLWSRAVGLHFPPGWATVTTVLALGSYPFLDGLYVQQIALVVAFLMAAAAAAATTGRHALAGFCLALATIKPHTAVPMVACLLIWSLGDWRNRRRLSLGFMVTLAVLLVAAEVALPGWFFRWLENLSAWRAYTPLPLSRNLLGEVPGRLVEALLVLSAAAICWKARREPFTSPLFVPALLFTISAAIIVFPNGLAAYDHVLLIPVGLWLAYHGRDLLQASRAVRWLLLLSAVLLAWQWVAALLVSLVAYALQPGREVSLLLLSLPIRTVSAFPFALTALLALLVTRQWAPAKPASV